MNDIDILEKMGDKIALYNFYLPLLVTDVVEHKSYFLLSDGRRISHEYLNNRLKEYEENRPDCSWYDFLHRI